MPLQSLTTLICTVLTLFALGCSQGDRPPLGSVTGNLTIDGEPLSGVLVTFMPESGRAAAGLTDDSGKYELEYIGGVKGTKQGPNSVVILVPTDGKPSHPVPAKYMKPNDLKADVKSGRNTFDFDLEADTKVAKPKATPKGPLVD